jgi:hypothetical protein
MRLTWKKNKPQTGLRSIEAIPLGSKLHDGTTTYATVSAIGGGAFGTLKGWYWVAGWSSGVPHKNTHSNPNSTEVDAKKAARDYVVANLPPNPMVKP